MIPLQVASSGRPGTDSYKQKQNVLESGRGEGKGFEEKLYLKWSS